MEHRDETMRMFRSFGGGRDTEKMANGPAFEERHIFDVSSVMRCFC